MGTISPSHPTIRRGNRRRNEFESRTLYMRTHTPCGHPFLLAEKPPATTTASSSTTSTTKRTWVDVFLARRVPARRGQRCEVDCPRQDAAAVSLEHSTLPRHYNPLATPCVFHLGCTQKKRPETRARKKRRRRPFFLLERDAPPLHNKRHATRAARRVCGAKP